MRALQARRLADINYFGFLRNSLHKFLQRGGGRGIPPIQRCKIREAASVGSGRGMVLFVMMLLRHLTTSAAFID